MVLTDKDFGRAYMTDGWAQRFLVELFRTFTVLFVGYGHSDVVMNYLSRALLPTETKDRFVLTKEMKCCKDKRLDLAKWRALNIEPIYFPLSKENGYQALNIGVESLADRTRQSVSQWEQEVREIVGQPTTVANEEADDIVEYVLSDPTYARCFTDGATDPSWIAWLDERGYLDNLFRLDETTSLSERDGHLAVWLTDRFMHEHPEEVFKLIGRHDFQLHRLFLRELCRMLKTKKEHQLGHDALVRWISLLIESATQNSRKLTLMPDNYILPWIGEICIEFGQTDFLLEVFDVMAASYLVRGRRNTQIGDETGASVSTSFVYSFRKLHDLWTRGLKPKLDVVAEPLLERTVVRLSKQHRLYRTWESTDEADDTMSYTRSFIERYDAGSDPDPIHILIDVARDCLKYSASEREEVAKIWADRLVQEEAPILRRLAVFALPLMEDLSLEAKIEWLLSTVGLYDTVAHREIFQTMSILYSDAEYDQREIVIDSVLSYEWPHPEEEGSELSAAKRKIGWLLWLHRSEPDCVLVKKHLKCLQQQYPSIRPPEPLDLMDPILDLGPRFMGSPQITWTAQELLRRPPRELLDTLVLFEEDGPPALHHRGIYDEVGKAAIQDFEWGLNLAEELVESGNWDSEYWSSLMEAWSRELDETKHRRVLDRLGSVALYGPHGLSVARVLRNLVAEEGLNYAPALLEKANEIASGLWRHLTKKKNWTRGEITMFRLWVMSGEFSPCSGWEDTGYSGSSKNLSRTRLKNISPMFLRA